jgi:TATA-box binding protein (TBP) (component of TFIID and TFIIIB)
MLDENRRSNLFKFKQALMKFGKEQKKEEVEIEPMPTPSPLKISTITFCFNTGIVNYLNIIPRYIPIYDIDSPEVKSEQGQITYVKHIYSLPRGWTDKKPKMKKKKTDDEEDETTKNTKFPNQVTINFRYCEIRNISIMIFSNGAFKMAGLLSYAEGEWVASRVLEILKGIQINIYNSYNELPEEGNHLNDFNIVVTKNQMRTYRWLNIDNYTSWVPTDTMIDTTVKTISQEIVDYTIWHDVDTNFSKLCFVNKVKDYIKDDKLDADSLQVVYPFPTLHCVENVEKINIDKLTICMINSDFNFFFYIKSDVLRDLLTNEYKVDASYGQHGYNAVKCQYKWNPNIKNDNYPGMCHCETLCTTKTKSKNNCKIITISIFQNGNAIITGATDMKQLEASHNFILKVIKDNYELLYKKEPYTSRKKVVSGRTNSKNKKRTVIQLKKQNILNRDSVRPKIVIEPESDVES